MKAMEFIEEISLVPGLCCFSIRAANYGGRRSIFRGIVRVDNVGLAIGNFIIVSSVTQVVTWYNTVCS